jgi:hypothetical protein
MPDKVDRVYVSDTDAYTFDGVTLIMRADDASRPELNSADAARNLRDPHRGHPIDRNG